ncbi:MAG: spore cortex-lytic protein [Ruminococcaceae bacterium]|nr:spore cortex-lytic protein [Oscillospiraceae bacterium]
MTGQGAILPLIPETVRVHIGPAGSGGDIVEVSFLDYIRNVASNEIYPTWPEQALIANILAQISFALNRIYTEYYPSRGYDFDITSFTGTDQSFQINGTVYENIGDLVDRFFNSYIRRKGSVLPLFAQYCDGINTTCSGLSQWGTASLAEQGLDYFEILKNYYGEDIEIVRNAPIGTPSDSAPSAPLREGSSGNEVAILQTRLNRISANYPSIPKINPTDGIFGPETESAVRKFQEIFSLSQDGIVGDATWYKVRSVYNAVKQLNELISEGLTFDEVSLQYPEDLRKGMSGLYVSILQYYLNVVATFTEGLSPIPINGYFGDSTEGLVLSFQRNSGIAETGIVDEETWNILYENYIGIIESLPPSAFEGIARPFPGSTLRIGFTGEDVRDLQSYINVLASVYEGIPILTEDGIFGENTRDAVYTVQSLYNLTQDGTVDAITWAVIADTYDDIVKGSQRSIGQYPGYEIGGTQP